jgi:DmsE family decaheme c-type cytochrome
MGIPKWRGYLPALSFLILPLLAAALAPAETHGPQQTAAPPGYVGMETCAVCHEQTVAAFKDSIHGKRGFEMRSSRACETCHGPGKAHVDAEGAKGTIIDPAALPAADQSKTCLECHSRGAVLMWGGSQHDTRGLSCLSCHSVHKAEDEKVLLVKPAETDLCFYRASHHPIPEGKIECTNCHNPHGTATARLLVGDSVPETCYQCHAEKRGPFLWEHIPVREDCTNCHDPHGTNHLSMLVAKVPFLCQRCHSDTRHPGTLYGQAAVDSFSNRIVMRGCPNCHQNIHGSNHHSGKYFLR